MEIAIFASPIHLVPDSMKAQVLPATIESVIKAKAKPMALVMIVSRVPRGGSFWKKPRERFFLSLSSCIK